MDYESRRRERGRHGAPTSRLVFGLIVMLLGLMLTLDNFGLLEAKRFFKLWPLLLIVLGLTRLSRWAKSGGRPEGVGLLAVGAAFLLINFQVLQFRQLFPLFLLGLGAFMVVRAVYGEGRGKEGEGPDTTARIDAFVVMGGVKKASSAPDFQGGSAFAMMGGSEIDLRQASIQSGPATLDTFAVMGGIEIRVPEDWAVEIRGNAFLGGFEDKTRRPANESKRLVITGFAMMGGVEVKN